MEKVDYTALPLEELKKLGFMRWGRAPVPNLWLMPGPLLFQAQERQTLYGIDGEAYIVGIHPIDGTLLFGFLAYGVKVESDTGPSGPEIPPEKLMELSRGKERRMIQKSAKDRGMFIPE